MSQLIETMEMPSINTVSLILRDGADKVIRFIESLLQSTPYPLSSATATALTRFFRCAIAAISELSY